MLYDPVSLDAHLRLRTWLGSFALPARVCSCARNLDGRAAFLQYRVVCLPLQSCYRMQGEQSILWLLMHHNGHLAGLYLKGGGRDNRYDGVAGAIAYAADQ